MASLTEIGDQLYQLPPQDFVAARTAAATEARKAGDPGAARQIAALRRPTVAAWLVNLLALRRPDVLADWFALADRMRAAQSELRGADLRELSVSRKRLLDVLLNQVTALASAEGRADAARLSRADVANTLTAAFSDDEVASTVRAGRLVVAAAYSGMGQQPDAASSTDDDLSAWVPVKRPARKAEPPPTPAKSTVDAEAAEAELRAAEAELGAAEAQLAEETEAERVADDEVTRLTDELAGLRRQLTETQAELARAETEATAVTRRRKAAERRITAARRRLTEL